MDSGTNPRSDKSVSLCLHWPNRSIPGMCPAQRGRGGDPCACLGVLRSSDLVGTSHKTRENQWFGGRVSRVSIVRTLPRVTVDVVECVYVPACPLGLEETH